MNDLLRKYQREILIFIIVVVCVPFVVWVVPFGSGGSGVREDEVVATVGGVPVTSGQYINALNMRIRQMSAGREERPTMQELDQSGVAMEVLDQLIDGALLKYEEDQRGLVVSQEVVEQKLRELPMFQNEEGVFDPALYNTWVADSTGRNWNEIYKEVREGIAREVHLAYLTAGAHVSDAELRERVRENNTKFQVRYRKVEPPLSPTDEQIRATYDENPEAYKAADQKLAEYVAVSLDPPVPAQVAEVQQKIAAGEDFKQLAEQYNQGGQPQGELGWQTKAVEELDYRKPMFDLAVGAVSEPVYGNNGYFIYKVEEERTSETTGEREVFVRQIFLSATLAPEEREARDALALAVAQTAKDEGLEAASQEFSLPIQRTGLFTPQSVEIENVPRTDVVPVRAGLLGQESGQQGTVFDPITGRNSIYVGHIIETVSGAVPPFEEVADRVREDTVRKLKQEEDYRARVAEYVTKIKAQAKTLEDIGRLFPELEGDIASSKEITPQQFIFEEGVVLQGSILYNEVKDTRPGEMVGPVDSFNGDQFFVELLLEIEPTAEELAEKESEVEALREREMGRVQAQYLEDYLKYLRTSYLESGQLAVQIDNSVLGRILQRNTAPPAPETSPATEGAAAPAETPAS